MGTLTLTLLNRPYDVSDAVYLDACFLIATQHQKHKHYAQATLLWSALLREATTSNAMVYCSALVVDECLWGLTRSLHQDVHGRRSWYRLSRQDKEVVFRAHRPAQEKLVSLLISQRWLSFVDCGRAHIQPAFREMKQRGLQPRDAFHVALARECGAHGIITNDQDLASALASDPDIRPFDYATIDVAPPT